MSFLSLILCVFLASLIGIIFHHISFLKMNGNGHYSYLCSEEIAILSMWTIFGSGIGFGIGYGLMELYHLYGIATILLPSIPISMTTGYAFNKQILEETVSRLSNVKRIFTKKHPPTIDELASILEEMKLIQSNID